MRSYTLRGPGLLALNLALVVLILILDWITAPGIVVSILLCLPILASSASDRARDIAITFLAAAFGFWLVKWFGRDPTSPEAVWIPNRILTALSLPGCFTVALFLQSLRRRAAKAGADAQRTSDLNRLLLSLLAHDLRAPLGTSLQAIEYIGASAGPEIDRKLLDDVHSFLQRSLGRIDGILGLARTSEDPARPEVTPQTSSELVQLITSEGEAFADQARARGKELQVAVVGEGNDAFLIDTLVVRQIFAILIDNAVRYAGPGRIRLTGTIDARMARIEISDDGPGLTVTRESHSTARGSGLGLELCRALVHRTGGQIQVSRDGPDGTTFELRLPLQAVDS